MKYSYKALVADGGIQHGELEAKDQAAVVDFLNHKGWVPVAVEPARTGILAELNKPRSHTSLTLRQLRDFTSELATLLGAGLTLERSLVVIANMSRDKKRVSLLTQIIITLREGKSLALALSKQKGEQEHKQQDFPDFYINMIKAGEAGGNLELVLARLSNYLERAVDAREKIHSALIYPAFLLVMIFLTMTLLVTLILPQFEPIFSQTEAQLPTATWWVMQIAGFIDQHGMVLVLGMGLLALIIGRIIRRSSTQRSLHQLILRLPVLGNYRCQREFALLHRMTGILLQSGIPLARALGISRQTVSNSMIAESVDRLIERLREGSNLSDEYARLGFVPAVAVELTMVGESSGNLGAMLIKSADILDNDTQRLLDRMIAIMVPGLTILMGLIIAAIIGSVLMGIMSLNNIAY